MRQFFGLRRRGGLLAALICLAGLLAGMAALRAQFPPPAAAVPGAPAMNAPDFPAGFAWLNANEPLSFKTNL